MENNVLTRKLGLFPLTNIVVANMIGAGIFTTSGLLMKDLHNPLVMIMLWIVGGAIAICGALSYGELGAAIPRAGGEYAFLSRLYHPTLGFLSGWVSFFVGFSAPIAASAIGFVAYMTRAFPEILRLGIFDASVEAAILRKLYAILVIAIFTGIHVRGLEFGATVQNVLTILKVGLIVGLIFAGFAFGQGSWEHFSQGIDFHFGLREWKVIGLSLMWIMFAYSGWNASAYIGSEVKNPSRNLPRSLITGTGIVILLYFCLNLIYVYASSPADMEGVISIAGHAAGNLFGQSFERILSIMISFALFSSLSAYIILGPRVYYSMARDRYFFRFVSDVHKKYGVPAKSIMLQGGIAAIMVLFGTFDQLLTYMGFSLGIFPLLAVLGVFKVRRLKLSPYKMPGFPLAPVLYVSAGIAILTLAFFQRPTESSVAVATVLIGIPVYWIFKKKYRNTE
jgi:APA family basic amino acid/polyamine antiporter